MVCSTYQPRRLHPTARVACQHLARALEKGVSRRTAALPPARNTSRPHFAARGCEQATIPLMLWTTLRRDGNRIVRGDVARPREGRLGRGMLEMQ